MMAGPGAGAEEQLHAARLTAILAQSAPTHEALTAGGPGWKGLG